MPFVNLTKSIIFDLMTILLSKRLIFLYCLIAKVMHYHNLFTKLKLSFYFLSYVQFYLGSHFLSRALAAHQGRKVNPLKLFRL